MQYLGEPLNKTFTDMKYSKYHMQCIFILLNLCGVDGVQIQGEGTHVHQIHFALQ